jgi:hypothetical protein
MAPSLARRDITFKAVCRGSVRTNITTEAYFDRVAAAGVTVLNPSDIADAIANVIASGESGQAMVCNADVPAHRVDFPSLDSNREV